MQEGEDRMCGQVCAGREKIGCVDRCVQEEDRMCGQVSEGREKIGCVDRRVQEGRR